MTISINIDASIDKYIAEGKEGQCIFVLQKGDKIGKYTLVAEEKGFWASLKRFFSSSIHDICEIHVLATPREDVEFTRLTNINGPDVAPKIIPMYTPWGSIEQAINNAYLRKLRSMQSCCF